MGLGREGEVAGEEEVWSEARDWESWEVMVDRRRRCEGEGEEAEESMVVDEARAEMRGIRGCITREDIRCRDRSMGRQTVEYGMG